MLQIREFLSKTQAEYRVIKNAEKLATGHKFKGVPHNQLPFGPLVFDKPVQEEPPLSKKEKQTKANQKHPSSQSTIYTVNPLTDRAEDIFIDEELQMKCPVQTGGLSNLARMSQIKVEHFNADILMDEESTRSNLATTSNVEKKSCAAPQPKKKLKASKK